MKILQEIKDEVAKEYGHVNFSAVKNRVHTKGLDITDLIAFADKITERYAEQFKPRWIPVTEKLPDIGEEYNVVQELNDGMGGPVVTTLEWDNINKVWSYFGTNIVVEGVTHWMPLPEPPKED